MVKHVVIGMLWSKIKNALIVRKKLMEMLSVWEKVLNFAPYQPAQIG